MSKEQKILLLLIILVGAGGASLYVANAKKTESNQAVALQESASPSRSETSEDLETAKNEKEETSEEKSTAPAEVPSVSVVVGSSSAVKSSYTADVVYSTPENSSEKIHVKLTLLNNLISDISFLYDTPHKRESSYNLGNFEKALVSEGLVGKKLSDVNLSRVGGASLTTGAFMNAIKEISAKASA